MWEMRRVPRQQLVSLSVHKLDDWDLPVCLPNLDWLGIQLSWLHTHQVTVLHNTWVDLDMSHKQKCVQSTEVRQQEEGWRIVEAFPAKKQMSCILIN